MYCGNEGHMQNFVHQETQIVLNVPKKGRFSKLCWFNCATSKKNDSTTAVLLGTEPKTMNLKVSVRILVNAVGADTLLNTGSTLSHLKSEFSKRLKIDLGRPDCCVGLAVKVILPKV